jgi:hypothetical protein
MHSSQSGTGTGTSTSTGTDEDQKEDQQEEEPKVSKEPLESVEPAEQDISDKASPSVHSASVAFADVADPSPTNTEDDDTITADDEDISVDSDIRRARGIVPSLSFLTFDELEDAAISAESESSPSQGSTVNPSRLSLSESVSADVLSTSAGKRNGFLDANDARFSGLSLSAFQDRKKASPAGMRKLTLQQMLLSKAKQLTLMESESLQYVLWYCSVVVVVVLFGGGGGGIVRWWWW